MEHYEPIFEPTVIPMSDLLDDDDLATEAGNGNEPRQPASSASVNSHASIQVNSDEKLLVPNITASGSESRASSLRPERSATPTYENPLRPEVRYYSIEDYHNLYKSGELTPTAVAKAILPLIRRDVDKATGHSTAWFEVNVEHVLASAEASTARYRAGKWLGPLDGVPTAIKDEYDMDGYATTHGSINDYWGRGLRSVSHDHDEPDESYTSWCVRKVEEMGAVILGKLSMHEFGLDTSGNNPIFGTPRNPFNPHYYPGGSSSGTAYAVAAGLVPFALGADGGGSIRIPASFCGVLGIKPTHGRLSFKPNQNHSSTCAVNGPIAADAKSLAMALHVMAAPHPHTAFPPLPSRLLTLTPSAQAAGTVPLGVPRDWFERAHPTVQAMCRDLLQRLVSERNYHLVDVRIPFLVEGQIAHALVVLNDAATLLPRDQAADFTAPNRILLALGRTTLATDYLLAMKLRSLLMSHLAWLWKTHPGMVIVTPTTACPGWRIVDEKVELRHGISDGDTTVRTMEFVWLANFCGLPAVSVPAGFVVPEGEPGAGTEVTDPNAVVGGGGPIPVGLMGTGEWASEEALLQGFARDAEELGAHKRRRPAVWVDVVKLAKEEMAREAENIYEKTV